MFVPAVGALIYPEHLMKDVQERQALIEVVISDLSRPSRKKFIAKVTSVGEHVPNYTSSTKKRLSCFPFAHYLYGELEYDAKTFDPAVRV